MRKKYLVAPIMVLASILLSSCSLALDEVYRSDEYNSVIFGENYYRIWDSRIDSSNSKNKIKETKEYRLDVNGDLVFETFYEDNDHNKGPSKNLLLASGNDIKNSNYDYTDYAGNNSKPIGEHLKLSKQDESFKYGVLSKLYDGQLFCNGGFELVRVQIDEGGFGQVFDKQGTDLNYFALNFKAANDFKQENKPEAHISEIDIKVSFYEKDDDKYIKHTFIHNMDVLSNAGETYYFFGFKINSNVKNIQGISVEYNLLSDQYAQDENDPNYLEHALLLYEIFLPGTTWH